MAADHLIASWAGKSVHRSALALKPPSTSLKTQMMLSNSSLYLQLLPTCPLSEETTKNAEHATESTEPTMPLINKETQKDEDALPLLDITQDSDTEEEEQQETEVSHGNDSVLSTGSTSSLSVVESSPEPSKSAPTTPASVSRHELMLYHFISSFA